MKWAFLVVAIGMIGPLASWLRRNPEQAYKIWILFGLLPFIMGSPRLYVAPISWAYWPGYVRGIEVSLLDTIAIAVYFSLPKRQRSPIPFRLSMLFYFSAVLFAAFQSNSFMASSFYLWQLARMFLIYAVVVKGCVDERMPSALLKGMLIGLIYQAIMAILSRIEGAVQTGGTLGHQNSLGMMTHFVIMPTLALLMAGWRGWLPMVGLLSGILAYILTASRASLGLAAVGLSVVFLVSALRGWTSRKRSIALLGVIGLIIAVPLALGSLERRFEAQPIDEAVYDERAVLEKAADMVLSDHPLGIGPNTFVVIANIGGYYSRAGVAWTSFAAHVHNTYWLVAAESGYLGLFSLIILLFRPLWVAAHFALRYKRDAKADLLLGVSVSLLVVYVHSFFEWVTVTFFIQYMLAMMIGLVAGLAQQLGYWTRSANIQAGPAPTQTSIAVARRRPYFLTPEK